MVSEVNRGEVTLTTLAGDVEKPTTFDIIDRDMAYNVILGRPWLYDMRVVASTYHHLVKFPAMGGVQKIRGDIVLHEEALLILAEKPEVATRTEAAEGLSEPMAKRVG